MTEMIKNAIISAIRDNIAMSDYVDNLIWEGVPATDVFQSVFDALATTIYAGPDALNAHLADQAQAGLQREHWGCEDSNNAYESLLAHLDGEDPHSDEALLQGLLLCVQEQDLFDALVIGSKYNGD